VESHILTSEDIYSLLEHGANTVIAALNNSLAHDNEPSDLPSYDDEMSLKYETPGLASTESKSHKGFDISGITDALSDPMPHDNESSDLPIYDDKISLKYETPGLSSTESESHKGFDISGITEAVESTILTSGEVQCLLEDGFDAFIAALSDPVPHDNESSDLPIYDDEISLKYETPGLSSTESESRKALISLVLQKPWNRLF
jgi:hypothetical protein